MAGELTFDESTAQPATPATPAAAGGGGLTFDESTAQPATAAATQPDMQLHGLGGWANRIFANNPNAPQDDPAWGMARGGVESAGHVGATILDMMSNPARLESRYKLAYKLQHPLASDDETHQAFQQEMQGWGNRLSGHMQDAVKWLRTDSEPAGFWDHIGAIGEQALEWLGTDGLFKMVGPAAKATEAVETGSRAVQAIENMKRGQQAAATFSNNPKIAGLVAIGLKASKDAAVMGGQTYAHTEDPKQAAIAAVMGGGLSAGMGAGQSYLERIAPKTLNIGGVETPALASQLNEAGEPLDVGAAGAPKIAQAQQRAAQQVIRNTAAQATANAIDQIAQSRPMWEATENTSRMLAAGAPSEPVYGYGPGAGTEPRFRFTAEPTFSFKVEGTPTTEGTTGPLTHPAEPIAGPTTTPASYGRWVPAERSTPYTASPNAPSTTAEPPQFGPFTRGQEAGVTAERRGPGYLHPATPAGEVETRTDMEKLEGVPAPKPAVEGRADAAKGGGNLETTDPREAAGWLRQIEDLQATPEHAQLPAGQQAAIEAQRKALQDQLNLYHNSPYAQRFVAPNIWDHIENVHTFGDAADEIHSMAEPVYQTLDRVSGGEFNTQKEIAKRQLKVMRNPPSEEAYQNAAAKLRQANAKIGDIIDRNRNAVSVGDYMTARNAWRQGSRLDELHAVFEGMMNGVSAEQAARTGMPRIMTGNARALNNYLEDETNREQIRQLIGNEGIDNLTRITLLLSHANTARAGQSVASEVATELSRRALGPHIEGGGVLAAAGALGGGALAHALGIPEYYGAIGGAVGTRAVLRIAATSPRIGRMVDYAVRNGLSAQHYAPLIARAIAEPFEKTTPAEEEQPEEQPQQ